jgi:hypothetical protein
MGTSPHSLMCLPNGSSALSYRMLLFLGQYPGNKLFQPTRLVPTNQALARPAVVTATCCEQPQCFGVRVRLLNPVETPLSHRQRHSSTDF